VPIIAILGLRFSKGTSIMLADPPSSACAMLPRLALTALAALICTNRRLVHDPNPVTFSSKFK
jgi:hypothetical protein